MRKEKSFVIKNLKWIILFICLLGFLIFAIDVFNKTIFKIDIFGYKIIFNIFFSDNSTKILKFITNLGSAMFLIVITILLLILIKNKKIGISIILNLLIISGFNVLLKNILHRPRPTQFRLIEESGYSFPSGHSMNGMAFYGLLIYLIYKNIKNKNLKWSLICLLSILICFIGISRIYLGVHYTSDVIAGFLISVSYLIIYTNIIKKFILEQQNK